MEKRPPMPSDGIQQKTTSRIALIGIAAATMMITVSIIAIQQEASAAKPVFCIDYTVLGTPQKVCRLSMAECREYRSEIPEEFNPSRCHPEKI